MKWTRSWLKPKPPGATGGKLIKPAAIADWGGYSGYFADPDGHLWEVA